MPVRPARRDEHDQDRRDQTLRRPEARHVGPTQEGARLPGAALSGKLHPVDLRFARGLSGRDAGARRRRPLLQPRGDPDRRQDRGGQRLRPDRDRQGRHPVDPRRVGAHPPYRRLRRDHPVGESQPRRPGRRLRRQVQHRRRRPRAREDHRRHLRPQQDDRRLQNLRRARHRHRPAAARRRSKAQPSRSSTP